MANPLADIPKLSPAVDPAGVIESGDFASASDIFGSDCMAEFDRDGDGNSGDENSHSPGASTVATQSGLTRSAIAGVLPELWRLDSVTVPGRHRGRLNAFSAAISGSCIAIIGDSGAGKSSLLELLAGFITPRTGTCQRLFGNGRLSRNERPSQSTIQESAPVDDNSSSRLPVFWMPHDFGLWPHLTVAQQIIDVLPPNSDAATASVLMRDFDLVGLASAYPEQLSQGEQARTAIARAVATGARVLLLDEPFSHLDPLRRYRFWSVLNQWCKRQNTAVVFTSHVPDEVLRYADWLLAVRDGSCLFCGPPAALYNSPPDERAAWLLGPVNWFESGDDFSDWFGTAAASIGSDAADNGPVTPAFGLRPEQVAVIPDGRSAAIVESVSSSSGLTTVAVRHSKTNETRDLFVHGDVDCGGPSAVNGVSVGKNGTLAASNGAASAMSIGQRVRLAILGVVLMLCLVTGCQPAGATPALAVSAVNYIPTPVSGAKTPSPRAVSFGVDNEFFVLDNAGRVLRYNESRELLQQWFMPAYSVGRPEGICRLHDGRIAVADTHYHRVVLFDSAGKVERMWGTLGLEPGEFVYPIAILQTPDGSLYVSEYGEYNQKDRVQKFTPDGKFLLEFGSQGTGPGQFQRPSGLAWYDGLIYVADAFNNRIQMFTEQGEYRGVLGNETPPSDMNYPYDLAIDSEGMLYVVEYGAGRVSKYDRQGRLLGRFGHVGNGPMQFSTPWGLAVRNDGRVLVADTGNRRIVELIP